MKSNDTSKDPLEQLITRAREEEVTLPPMAAKFPAEVVRRAWSGRFEPAALKSRVWLGGLRWGMAGAVAIMVVSVLLNVRALTQSHVTSEAVFHQQVAQLVLTP